MFVFGLNLPVAEILFVVLVLFIVALVFIIIQLTRMGRHVRVLDETTLEIRRYEEAEEVTLRTQETNVHELRPAEKKRVESFADAMRKLETKAMKQLLSGEEPDEIKHAFLLKDVPESLATKVVNNTSYMLDKAALFEAEHAKRIMSNMKSAARK